VKGRERQRKAFDDQDSKKMGQLAIIKSSKEIDDKMKGSITNKLQRKIAAGFRCGPYFTK